MKPTYAPLTDAEWALVGDLFSSRDAGLPRRPRVNARLCADAVFHVLTVKCGWKDGGLPKNVGYPSIQTVYRRYIEWRDSGVLPKAIALLNGSRGVVEPERTEEKPKLKRAGCNFGGAENLEAMQAIARGRLMEGKPANWKVRDEATA